MHFDQILVTDIAKNSLLYKMMPFFPELFLKKPIICHGFFREIVSSITTLVMKWVSWM